MAGFTKASAESRRKVVKQLISDTQRAAVQYRNIAPLRGLTEGNYVRALGKVWEIPPVPFGLACDILEIRSEMMDLREELPSDYHEVRGESVGRYRRLLDRAVRLLPSLTIPQRSGPVRWLWKLGIRRNPWRRATEGEITEMLGFCLRFRTRSPARSRPEVRAAHRGR